MLRSLLLADLTSHTRRMAPDISVPRGQKGGSANLLRTSSDQLDVKLGYG
jgi:hypothetical protein